MIELLSRRKVFKSRFFVTSLDIRNHAFLVSNKESLLAVIAEDGLKE